MRLKIFDLGLVDYKTAWDLQKETHLAVKNKIFPSCLILCQHYPVITLGRTAAKKNILAAESALKLKGVEVHEIERGGDVTYHGPGQLTVYPIINLGYFKKDIHLFLRYLEDVVIDLLSGLGIEGARIPGLTGVWVNRQKIASIGIAIKQWITFHGLSINVRADDLANFSLIRPCGMDIKMTSLETVLKKDIRINDIKQRIILKTGTLLGSAPKASLSYENKEVIMVKVVLPELGEGIEKATVSYWYFKEGEKVSEKDDLVEITTDKATFNLPSPCSGILSEIFFREGDAINVGEALGLIDES